MSGVREIVGAERIGRYGYAHYTGRPGSPGHELALVPQSIADGWEGLCSCGEWQGFANFYDYKSPGALKTALRAAHYRHVQANT